jgi:hypothetical protein
MRAYSFFIFNYKLLEKNILKFKFIIIKIYIVLFLLKLNISSSNLNTFKKKIINESENYYSVKILK